MSRISPVIETSFELKHRLVGALILIVFGVVVFPMILVAPQRGAEEAGSIAESAESDNKVFISRITPIGGATPPLKRKLENKEDTARAGGKPAVDAVPPPVAQQPRATKATTKARPIDPQGDAGAKPAKREGDGATAVALAKPKTGHVSPSAAPQPIERGWIVRIGTFSKSENALRIMQSLTATGFTPSSERVKTSRGVLTRVWVGPFAQRVEAGRARSSIQQAIGEKGLIAAFP